MPQTIAQKLKLKEGYTLLVLNKPADFIESLGTLPANVSIATTTKNYNQIHWFVKNKMQMEKELNQALSLIKDDIVCWIYYPKGSSKIQTDLTRDKGWELFLAYTQMHWISLISFDETWSTFGCRLKNATDIKKDAQPKQREIFNYINATTKTITLPEDLGKALKENASAQAFFNTLSFSNKKEYVEWIITAKKIETRNERIIGTIERLNKSWKNPRNM